MRDDACSGVLVGRVFVILGVKYAEMAKSERKFRAHAAKSGEQHMVEIRHIETKLQKGSIYTKAMVPAQFSAEGLLIGTQRPSNHSSS